MLIRTKVLGLMIAALLILTLAPGPATAGAPVRGPALAVAPPARAVESLNRLNDSGAYFTDFSAPAASSVVQDSLTPLSTGTTTRVSVKSDGEQGNSTSDSPSISADGRYVAFHSGASNLVGGDTNGAEDIFVHDRQTGETTRVSVASDGEQGNGGSYLPSISADGKYVAFQSYASNLVSGDTNDWGDVFVHDRETKETTRVSVASDGGQGNHHSGYHGISISADGRYVAFQSWASNLVSGDTNDWGDVFVHDRETGETTRVSVASDGGQGNGDSIWPSISADGRYVAFYSRASNLVDGDTNGTWDIFVHDRQTGETTRVSIASDGNQGNGESGSPSISAAGRYVAFSSYASNLVSGDTNGATDVFIHDRQTGEMTRVSVASDGGQGNNSSWYPSISDGGRYVAFYSGANNLVSGDTNDERDIFVHDRQTGETTRVSVASDGSQGNDESHSASISADGKYVAFCSWASNLVSGDTNGYKDVFVHDRGASGPYAISGRVSDGSSNPISGVAVSAGGGGSATTDTSGAYTLTGLIPGTYMLTASKSGYVFSPAARVVRVPPSISNQDFTTTSVCGTLNGRVTVQGSGTAIANARVSAGGKVGRTDASGDYILIGILPGLHNIYVSADGYKDYKGEVTIEAATSTTGDVALAAILVDGYYLPYSGGKTYECTQGNGGSFSHQGSWYYAFDFGMPDGRKVVAARDGRVVTVKEDSNTSCNSKACIPYANYVRIRHEDGTDTLYYHLKYQSVFVEEGQLVSRGQVIAESDTTGWCTGAHLDFTRHEWGQWKSRPISFVDVPGDGVPKAGNRYTSGNYPVTTGVAESNMAEDTDPPRGSVQFRLTGLPTHTLQLWAADYASDVTAMRLAATETGIQAATWQSFTTSAEWTAPVVFAQYKDANSNVSSVVSDTVDAIGYEPIQAAFAISPTVCVGSGLPLTNQTVPFCEQCGWAWDFGDGTTSAEAEPQFDYVAMSSFPGYATPDTYTVTLTVSNVVSASSVSHQVTALAAPPAEFSLIRLGATITVAAEATDAAGWTWNFGDGITATGRLATHTYTDTALLNTYPVQLLVERNNGCASFGHQYVPSYALYLPLILRNY